MVEGPCPILLSVTQNNFWLVAESNVEKKYRVQPKSIALLQKLQNKIKKIVLKCKEMFLFEKIDKKCQI